MRLGVGRAGERELRVLSQGPLQAIEKAPNSSWDLLSLPPTRPRAGTSLWKPLGGDEWLPPRHFSPRGFLCPEALSSLSAR